MLRHRKHLVLTAPRAYALANETKSVPRGRAREHRADGEGVGARGLRKSVMFIFVFGIMLKCSTWNRRKKMPLPYMPAATAGMLRPRFAMSWCPAHLTEQMADRSGWLTEKVGRARPHADNWTPNTTE